MLFIPVLADQIRMEAMAMKLVNRQQSKQEETREVRFRCKYCGKTKPLDEIMSLTRFFPPVVACQDCAKKMQ